MLILDRYEDRIAYISTDDGIICADRSIIAADVSEGNVLCVQDGMYEREAPASQARIAHMHSLLMKALKQKQ